MIQSYCPCWITFIAWVGSLLLSWSYTGIQAKGYQFSASFASLQCSSWMFWKCVKQTKHNSGLHSEALPVQFELRLSSVNQDRIICGLFARIISNNPQITTALYAIIWVLFGDYLSGYLSEYCQVICQVICSGYLSGYLRLFAGYLQIISAYLLVICWGLFDDCLRIIVRYLRLSADYLWD